MQPSSARGKLNPITVYDLLPNIYEVSYPSEVKEPDSFSCGMNDFQDGIAGLPATSCFDVPGNSWVNCLRRVWRREVPVSDKRTGSYILVKDAGLKIVTNTQLGCAPNSLLQSHVTPSYPQGAGLEEDEQAGVRQDAGMQMDFLETWLWELVPVGEGGSAEVAVTVPDAITKWEAGMFCTSPLALWPPS
ncbi:alpha-2-macroglobulin-like protein 1 [Athene noctua]|uniref:alpha-2-macroglobulin-like protein 1 n=1 Tax=Athene noctua TaxID=126797 RepID=UPI003EB77A0F